MIALLVAGSAISLMGCGTEAEPTEADDEKIVTRVVRDMEVLSSRNGERNQLMRSPLREEHAFARPAFETFPEGMEVIGYDSLGRPSTSVVADYALHWTERDLWELNGNVVVEGEEGQKLFTQQLRWDRKINKIYSNVDSKVEEDGDVLYGVGFEAADDFSRWVFRGVTGTVTVEMRPTADSASTAVRQTAVPASGGPTPPSDGEDVSATSGTSGADSAVGDTSSPRDDISSPRGDSIPAESDVRFAPARSASVERRPVTRATRPASVELAEPEQTEVPASQISRP